MKKTKNIIIDCFGNDLGYQTIIKGVELILNQLKDISITLVGDSSLIKPIIDESLLSRINFINATTEISNNDCIIKAIYDKKDASVLLGLKELSENNSSIGMISFGNSGALLMGCLRYLKVNNVRPCMGALLPTINDKYVLLVDAGSTNDCDAHQIQEFAHLGSSFMKDTYGISSPKVALLSNGSESNKGNKVTKETYALLKEDQSINFIGNIEANNIFNGEVDVIAGDGFIINQVIKTIEGTGKLLINEIISYTNDSSLGKHLLLKYDLVNLGGGVFLGVKKPVIKLRGNGQEKALLSGAKILLNIHNKTDLYKEI